MTGRSSNHKIHIISLEPPNIFIMIILRIILYTKTLLDYLGRLGLTPVCLKYFVNLNIVLKFYKIDCIIYFISYHNKILFCRVAKGVKRIFESQLKST